MEITQNISLCNIPKTLKIKIPCFLQLDSMILYFLKKSWNIEASSKVRVCEHKHLFHIWTGISLLNHCFRLTHRLNNRLNNRLIQRVVLLTWPDLTHHINLQDSLKHFYNLTQYTYGLEVTSLGYRVGSHYINIHVRNVDSDNSMFCIYTHWGTHTEGARERDRWR